MQEEVRAADNLLLLETNIDDMNPQIYGYLYDRLFEAGARDVWTTPIYMKKNRPGQMLSVLASEDKKDACASIIFRETTSIGIRVRRIEERLEADRHLAKVDTKYGDITCKVSAYGGHLINVAPEYEDCCRAAREKKVPLKLVQQEAMRAFEARLGD
ncbi:nickel insertion protein [Selenomonas sp. AB3002]|uniref:nickel insertion protein n=1 Tax=Selenomonas sp. AB3002 TaxID=1392502 RepID=UPI00068CB397